MKAVLDTRFFMHSLENKNQQFQKWARATLNTLQLEPNVGVVPSMVIHEFYALQLADEGKEVAELRTDSILKLDLEVKNLDVPIAVEAARLRCKYGELPTADAVIAATAVVLRCDCVLTDDRHIRQIHEVKTKWI